MTTDNNKTSVAVHNQFDFDDNLTNSDLDNYIKEALKTDNNMKATLRTLLSVVTLSLTALCASAQLPSVQLKDLAGNPVDTSTLGNDGKPFIIDFWATWCKPCVRELKAIHELYPDWVDETGVKVYAVSVDDAQNSFKVKAFVEKQGWEYVVLLDPNGEFKQAMGASNVPHTVLLDGNGKVVESHSGYTDGSEEHLIDQVRKLIEK